MLVNMKDMLAHARQNRYAVGLFNTINLEMAKGVLAAAEEARSPVIIGTAEVFLPLAAQWELAAFLRPMAQRATVPVVLHFDHGLTEENIIEALACGFTSVMYDCSTESFEDNAAKVARMAQTARRYGATIEAELGHVGANEDAAEGPPGDESVYTNPAQARAFVRQTGVDALAVAIGNAHGAYRAAPKLDLDRLREIAAAVDVPLVLHGGSGLSDGDFRACIREGISKVNIFTDINTAAAAAAAQHYAPGKGMTDLAPAMAAAVREATLAKMELFGSVGRA